MRGMKPLSRVEQVPLDSTRRTFLCQAGSCSFWKSAGGQDPDRGRARFRAFFRPCAAVVS